ncbi:uncharacterized protein N0V89_009137 [Didymosphaeria variabile]|uniref:Uncharacterized protein n=1 Tax=Didymosphaeria variabile TaxID=1932322 RepID=A0A9W8XH21_9PLEO|nr:uncharacterized protein N0V89_009137 [Didymosphaeria variabile]KAJ4350516.1 hypothetical protein N0V89_009137 [Didymosphaeria variabile]
MTGYLNKALHSFTQSFSSSNFKSPTFLFNSHIITLPFIHKYSKNIMKTTNYVALALSCLFASSISAPTPGGDGLKEVTGILGSITDPSAGDGNKIIGNGQDNGNSNGNGNAAGNGNGDGNSAGNGNQGGNGNAINFERRGNSEEGLTAVLGSITNPSAGDGNTIDGNGAGNGMSQMCLVLNVYLRACNTNRDVSQETSDKSTGNGNGNGNSAGNGNGNGNSAGNGNQAGNANSINVGDVTLPSVTLPDVDLSPSIKSVVWRHKDRTVC